MATGDAFIFSQYVVGRDPRFFEEPLMFLPERWLEPRQMRMATGAYFPFGSGPRMCLGKNLAITELVVACATINQMVDIDVPQGAAVHADARRSLVPLGMTVVITKRR